LLLATGSSLNAALCARYFFEQRFGVLVDIKDSAYRVLAGKGLNRRQLLPVVAQDLRQTGRLFADICWRPDRR
jgi:glucosamine 6-phosphate synthetase-like amidotransferase/phosphosugar isomerase protein